MMHTGTVVIGAVCSAELRVPLRFVFVPAVDARSGADVISALLCHIMRVPVAVQVYNMIGIIKIKAAELNISIIIVPSSYPL
jgi:hypothetical protein